MSDYTLTRPNGMTDARWNHVLQVTHLMLTGHASWCEEHDDGGSPDPRDGYCRRTVKVFCAEIEITNAAANGEPRIGLHMSQGTDYDLMTLAEANAVSAGLEEVADWLRLDKA